MKYQDYYSIQSALAEIQFKAYQINKLEEIEVMIRELEAVIYCVARLHSLKDLSELEWSQIKNQCFPLYKLLQEQLKGRY